MISRDQVLAALSRHIGHKNGVHVETLAWEITGIITHPDDPVCRRVRQCISELREEGSHICGHPSTGYFMAADEEELERYYIEFLRARALHSLMLISRAKKIALPDLIGQLRLVEKA